jgi:hypothetical protein
MSLNSIKNQKNIRWIAAISITHSAIDIGNPIIIPR